MHSNIRNRLFSLLLTFAMLFALFPTSALAADSGAQLPDNWENCTDCSAENPHLISTKEDLNKIRTHTHTEGSTSTITGYFKLANDIVFDNADFAEDGAFYNGGKGFEPIGVYGKPVNGSTVSDGFRGVFDGGDHIISGVKIHNDGSYGQMTGLFGWPRKSKEADSCIKNLVLKNFDVEYTGTNESGYAAVGAIAGFSWTNDTENPITIDNCAVYDSSVRSTNYKCTNGTTNAVGGIVGRLDASSAKNCTVAGVEVSGLLSVGGVCGVSAGGVVDNCVVDSSSTKPTTVTGDIVGGVVGNAGSSYFKVLNSYSNCVVRLSADHKQFQRIGGIAGDDYSSPNMELSNNVAVADIDLSRLETSQTYAVGGLIGFVAGSQSRSNNHDDVWNVKFRNVPQEATIGAVGTTSGLKTVTTYTNCTYICNQALDEFAGADSSLTVPDKLRGIVNEISVTYGSESNILSALPQSVTCTISDEKVVSIGSSNNLKALSVGNATVVLSMEKNQKNYNIATIPIEVSAKEVGVTMNDKTGDDAETYDGTAKTIAVNETGLPDDLGDLVYSYKVATTEDSTYTHTPPTAPGTYTVKVESGNDNYRLIGDTEATLTINPANLSGAVVTPKQNVFHYTGSEITPDVTVVLGGKTLVKDKDYKVTYSNNTSAGTARITVTGTGNYTGTATTTFTISSTAPTVTTEDVSVTYDAAAHGLNVTTSSGTVSYYSDSALSNEFAGATNAGTYTVYYKITGATGFEGSVTGSATLTITPATLTITADNKTMYVNGTLPTYTYTVTGWKGSDSTLTTAPTVTCEADGKATGTYTITASGATASENYTITYNSGTLTVYAYSSGGGSSSSNVNGSGDDVSISASGGSVTAFQMESAVKKADEGAAITIKSTSSTTVTLPVGGMEKAADNDNDVRLDLRYGEITLSARAIAGMTDGISSNDKIKISITSQASSKDETISDLLDKGAAVFDVSVTVNDVEVHSFDGTLTITLTVSNLSKITDPHILHILTSGTKEYYAPDSISGNTITVKGIRNLSTFAVIPGSEVPQNNPFADVSTSDYYYDAVLWAVENGVTNGTSATTFSPDMAVSRAQMVTFLWRAHGSPKATGTNPFTDVSTSDYYYDAVQWAVANGVTTGTSATTFSPDAPVTRAQAVTFQWRAAGSLVVSGSSFDDVAADAYYVNAVTWAVANGITNGTGGNNFSPDAAVSRAQAVTFLYREQE